MKIGPFLAEIWPKTWFSESGHPSENRGASLLGEAPLLENLRYIFSHQICTNLKIRIMPSWSRWVYQNNSKITEFWKTEKAGGWSLDSVFVSNQGMFVVTLAQRPILKVAPPRDRNLIITLVFTLDQFSQPGYFNVAWEFPCSWKWRNFQIPIIFHGYFHVWN